MSSTTGGFFIKAGDREPSMLATLLQADGTPVDNLAGATLQLRWKRVDDAGAPTLSAAVIVDDVAAIVRYDWSPGDTDTPGTYEGEWVATKAGKLQTVPSRGVFYFTVTPIIT